MGPHKVGGAQARGLWYVTIRSVPVAHLHNSNETLLFRYFLFHSQFPAFLFLRPRSEAILRTCSFNKHPSVGISRLHSVLFSNLLGLSSLPRLQPGELWRYVTAVEALPHLSAACRRLNSLDKLLSAKWPIGFRTVCYASGAAGQKIKDSEGNAILQIRILDGL